MPLPVEQLQRPLTMPPSLPASAVQLLQLLAVAMVLAVVQLLMLAARRAVED